MKIFAAITTGTMLIANNAYALDQPMKNQLRRIESLARSRFAKDITIEAKKIDEGVCGANGPSFVIAVKLKKIKKTLDENSGQIRTYESWDVIKTYGIPVSSLTALKNRVLMDADACLE